MATEEAVDDIMRAREWAARIVRSTSPGGRAAALSVGYVALYLALDRLSFIGALHGIGITPWNPSTGLAMPLLIIKGLRYAPLIMAAELLSGATLRLRQSPRCRFAWDHSWLQPAIREQPQYCGMQAFRPVFAGARMSSSL
ncbi:MAG TPA: hypothetical protein VNZ53_04050 [Steroidobacteraceae bacterium]|jgi:hypothetical protein|nr:hypothetical protein [Steroidobacteraceae bacterium]